MHFVDRNIVTIRQKKANTMKLSSSIVTFATMLITTAAALAWQTPVRPVPAPVFTLHVSEDGVPRTISLSADGAENAFTPLADATPDWMFSRERNAIRLTARGVCDSVESASVRFGPNPAFIILR